MNERNDIGLVLSGGGFRGIAHIGVIKLLEELNITPSYISGTSAGGLVGALYAGGFSSGEILEFFRHTKLFNWKNYAFRKAGILEPTKFFPAFKKYFPDNSFEALHKKLYLAVTNLETGAGEIISSGELIPSLLASAALPLMFAPVNLNGVLYADGGIVNNFPVKPLLPYCKRLIGVYVNPLEMKKKQELEHTYAVMERAFHIAITHDSVPKFSHCDVMIVPEKLKDHSMMDVNHIEDIFDIGYEEAKLHQSKLELFLD